MRPTQHSGYLAQSVHSRTPESLMEPLEVNVSSSMKNQATLFAPSQATSVKPFVDDLSGGVHERATSMQLDPSFAQKHRYQRQWQQKMQQEAQQRYTQCLQRQRSNIGQQHYQQQLHHYPSAQHDQARQQHSFPTQPPCMVQQEQHLRDLCSTTSAAFGQLLTPQQTPEQVPNIPDLPFKSLATTHPLLQKSITLGFKDTTQQFEEHGCATTSSLPQVAIPYLPSPQTTPVRHNHTPPSSSARTLATTPQLQVETAAFARAKAAYRNEVAEHIRLGKERLQDYKKHLKRREELKRDTSAIYHNYSEVLEYFPPGRGEHPSPYLTGLLANQPVPAESTSDVSLAIKYAKQHWENFWELKDLDYVVEKAKQEIEKKMEERAVAAPRR